MTDPYDSRFFEYHNKFSYNSAKIIVPSLLQHYKVGSVLDIGCGNGAWLKAFQDNFINNVEGFDLADLPYEEYIIDKKLIRTNVDMASSKFIINNKVDLIICLEVLEHIPKNKANNVVKYMTNSAPVILFSAAIPGQMGHNHINEQLPSYWKHLFARYNFKEIDFLRPLIWKDPRVAWWYRQNITLFVDHGFLLSNKQLLELSEQFPTLSEDQNLLLISERILRAYKQNPIDRLLQFLKKSFSDKK